MWSSSLGCSKNEYEAMNENEILDPRILDYSSPAGCCHTRANVEQPAGLLKINAHGHE